ncbi:MAG: cohesin domain-containing protein [Anaerolineae bacterium]
MKQGPQEDATLWVGSGEVEPGGSVTVPLSTSLGTHLLGATTVQVDYDPAVVEAVACHADPGGLFDFALCNLDTGSVIFTAISAAGASGNPLLAEIVFQALGTVGESSALILTPDTFADPDGGAIPTSTQNGLITILTGALAAPTNLVAVAASQTEIGLTWHDNSADESLFLVERSPDGSSAWSEIASPAADTMGHVDQGLDCGTRHHYRVRAYRASDGVYSAYSNVDSATTWACSEAVLSIGSGVVEPGGSVTVPMTTSLGAYLLGATTVQVDYDPAVVEAIACDADPGGEFDFALCNIDLAPDQVGLTAISAFGVSGYVVLAEVTFLAVGETGESSSLTLTANTFAHPGGQPLAVTVHDGQLDIAATSTIYLPLVLNHHSP